MEIIAKYWREILLILFAYHSLTSFSYIEDKVDDIYDVAGWVDNAPQIKKLERRLDERLKEIEGTCRI
jgi:hypothetical protein